MRSDRHKKKKKKWLKPLLIIVSALVIILIAGAGYYAYRLHSFISDISVSREITDENEQADFQRINDKKPFSILLLGVDLEDGLTSRTDSIMVATVNPDTKDTKLVSIPRDTLVETNFGFTEKINAMHTFGGIELMITEVEKLMDIPIAHYAILDFQGLAALVDAVGGIEIYSDMAFTESNSLNYEDPIEIEEGLQTLNGE